MAIFAYPYARERGLGRDMKDNVRWPQVMLATAIAILASLVSCRLDRACWPFVLAGLCSGWERRFILRRIPGLTGDSYGALCELAELVVLLFFTLESIAFYE